MKNFYDLLGARPDDDAETLRKAYRKAAKASHPDHHGGDQDAAAQFRQILETYNILRDAEQRAAYNRFLEFQREPLRAKLKRAISELKHHILYDAVAAVVLTIAVAGGCSSAFRKQPSMKQPGLLRTGRRGSSLSRRRSETVRWATTLTAWLRRRYRSSRVPPHRRRITPALWK
jgi:curved DNA-binding protein CbpA